MRSETSNDTSHGKIRDSLHRRAGQQRSTATPTEPRASRSVNLLLVLAGLLLALEQLGAAAVIAALIGCLMWWQSYPITHTES